MAEQAVFRRPNDGARLAGELVVEIPVGVLLTDRSPRSSGTDPDHVAALAALAGPLPPIIVHWPTMRVVDGLHRLTAARLRGRETILGRFVGGGEADAFVLGVSENTARGLPLSLPDRKRAARRILDTFPHWSSRRVAAATGLSGGTVGELRRRTLGDGPDVEVRIGRDGRARPTDLAEGRRIAREMIIENPRLSLRQIARSAGLSPETVRTLKNRLLNGPGEPAPALVEPKDLPKRRADREDGATLVQRLKADPALRLRESGRDLLRLLHILMISPAEWERLVETVPPAERAAVAQLARTCAAAWAEFARRVGTGPTAAPGTAALPAAVQVRGSDSWTGTRRRAG